MFTLDAGPPHDRKMRRLLFLPLLRLALRDSTGRHGLPHASDDYFTTISLICRVGRHHISIIESAFYFEKLVLCLNLKDVVQQYSSSTPRQLMLLIPAPISHTYSPLPAYRT